MLLFMRLAISKKLIEASERAERKKRNWDNS